jgi:oligopeptide transport system substrate-binding protein
MLRIALIPLLLLALLGASMIWSGQGHIARADFTFVNRGDVMTLDLNDMSYGQDIRIANGLWEGLYRLSPLHPEPILGAADDVKISPDQRVYTIHIRSNARWSNGDPLRSDDFLFAWRRMLESPKEYTYLHFYIKGAKDYEQAFEAYAMADLAHKPAKPDFADVGEKRIDDRTIQITLTNPVPYFPSILAFVPFYPMHQASMEPFKEVSPITGMVSYRAEFTRPPNLVTNGPYRLAEWLFKRRLRMVANEFYWNKDSVKSKVIDQITAEDPLARYRLYQQGDVDWLADVDGDIAATLLEQKDPKDPAKPARPDLKIFTGFGTVFYEINCQPKLPDGRDNPLRDPRVRQALAMAIDKVPIVRDVARLHQPIATTYVPIGAFSNYHSPPGIGYDVAGAKRLLADAGYPDGKGFPAISLLFNTTGSIHADIATIIRRQWSNALGISVDAHGEEANQYRHDLHNHSFAVAEASWSGDYNDPSTFSDKYLSTSENNSAAWADAKYDKLCADAAVEPDPTKRFNLLSQAEDRLLSEAPIIPLYTLVNAYLMHDDVQGLLLNPQQIQMFGLIYVRR